MSQVAADVTAVKLTKQQGRAVLLGRPWVFSNAIDSKHTSVKQLTAGETVAVYDYRDKFIGYGYANPSSLICIRLLSRDPAQAIDEVLIKRRLQQALALREQLRATPHYRLVYSESDGLAGLVVDRFAATLVVQITTAGMQARQTMIVEALKELLAPKCIILRNDSSIRLLENLERYTEIAHGEAPKNLEVVEGQAKFVLPSMDGQKTGWFYDQTDNRRWLPSYVKNRRVLDVCCYAGAWAIQAALHGAEHVTGVDQSADAIELLLANAEQNKVAESVTGIEGDAFAVMRDLRKSEQQFDTIVVDPPAFIKRKKDLKSGIEAYRRLNEYAMRLFAGDGILVSCSCSYHLPRQELIKLLQRAAKKTGKTLQILQQGYQSADHPINPAIPESEYLKVVYTRVLADDIPTP